MDNWSRSFCRLDVLPTGQPAMEKSPTGSHPFFVHQLTPEGLPSLLWHCWLGVRKSIWPVKNWVIKCWHCCMSRVSCKRFLASLKSRMVLPFWCRLTQVVLEKRPLNGCLSVGLLREGTMFQLRWMPTIYSTQHTSSVLLWPLQLNHRMSTAADLLHPDLQLLQWNSLTTRHPSAIW